MKETCPSGVMGFAQKLLAFDEAGGNDSRVARTAYKLFENRQRINLQGSAEQDWAKAEEIVIKRFAREIERKLA